jgi:AmmeMemoRadiSam system protein A
MRLKIFVFLSSFYLAICFLSVCNAQDNFLTDHEKEYLINLSRQTLYWYLRDGTIPKPDESTLSENLRQKRGCFVTLYKRNFGLRGCIGIFGKERMLYENVINRTIAAATQDSRFSMVKYDELKEIKIEISVLTEPKELQFNSPNDLLARVRPLKDGVILITKYGQSTFIPQVWEELPNKEEFMSALCEKQHAPRDTWRTEFKNIKILTYQAVFFHEEVYGRRVIGKNGAVVGRKGAYILGNVKPLSEGLYYCGYKVGEGIELAPGAIVTSDSDITEH